MKSFKIKTLGCKVNQYESQAMRERLYSAGYKELDNGQKAEVYVVNTCTVTQKADKESRETIRRCLRENPEAQFFITGCYAQADPDIIRGIDNRLNIFSKQKAQAHAGVLTDDISQPGITFFKGHTKGFVKIQDGCNNFCSYCKVPYVRGRSKSRPTQEVISEIEALVKNGYREIVLSGICLGNFGKDLGSDIDLVWLIHKISSINTDFRIRISSIELPDVTDALIEEMTVLPKLCRHLHIPLQSGDDEVLKKMNRKYTSSEFISRIEFIRYRIPGIAITTDIIVGFPGETDKGFNNTIKALERLKPARTHIFTYSPRRGTKSFEMEETISARLKGERARRLKKLADGFSSAFASSSLKTQQRVLIEHTRDKNTGLLCGYTDTYVKILIKGPDELLGRLIFYDNGNILPT